ncbi:unnamed protein product, partial [Prorocentrum cordatum]
VPDVVAHESGERLLLAARRLRRGPASARAAGGRGEGGGGGGGGGGQPRQERRARLRLGGARGRTDGRQLPARRRGRKRRCPAASCTARPWRRRGWCWRPRGHGRNTWASPLAPAPPHTASTSHPAPPRRAAGALPRDLRCTRSARRRRSGRGRPTPGRPVGTRLLAHRPAPLALPRQIGAWHQPPRGPPRRPWSGP